MLKKLGLPSKRNRFRPMVANVICINSEGDHDFSSGMYVHPATFEALNMEGRASKRISMPSLDSWRFTGIVFVCVCVCIREREREGERKRERKRERDR